MQSLKRQKVICVVLGAFVLFHACLFGQTNEPVPSKIFIPFPTNVLSCSIRLLDSWGKVEILIVNASSTRQVFSAPRIITAVDLQSETNIQVNTINFHFRWGDNRSASAEYGTFEKSIVTNKYLSLLPDETSKVVINLKDFYFSMRDNLVPFNECFTRGNSNIYVQASLVTVNRTKYTAVTRSNEENLKGEYIYEK
jgi:hypothetical protein